jgi:hypothetical protein
MFSSRMISDESLAMSTALSTEMPTSAAFKAGAKCGNQGQVGVGAVKSEGILALGALYTNPAKFGEFLNCGAAAQPTPTTVLQAAKRHLRLIVYR